MAAGTRKTPESSNGEIEYQPDAWERFERAVKVVAKSPPQHRVKPKKAKGSRKKAKRRR